MRWLLHRRQRAVRTVLSRQTGAPDDLSGRNSAEQSCLFTLKELLRGDVGSPRVLNLELGFGSLCEFEPRDRTTPVC